MTLLARFVPAYAADDSAEFKPFWTPERKTATASLSAAVQAERTATVGLNASVDAGATVLSDPQAINITATGFTPRFTVTYPA